MRPQRILSLACLVALVSGCLGTPDDRHFGTPAPHDWQIVPALFVGEAWNQTLGWERPDDAPSEASFGFLWHRDTIRRDMALADVAIVQTAATDTDAWLADARLEAPMEPGIWHVGTFILIDGQSFITPMQQVRVMERGDVHVVLIGEVPLGPASRWSHGMLEIAQGDAVVWRNDDMFASHDATSLDAPPHSQFATGALAPGASSEPVWFRATGETTYSCSLHPATMEQASIVVS